MPRRAHLSTSHQHGSTTRGISGRSAYGPECRYRHSGPFFLKFCSYFPFNAKLCINGKYAERPAMPHRVVAGLVGEPIAPGFAA